MPGLGLRRRKPEAGLPPGATGPPQRPPGLLPGLPVAADLSGALLPVAVPHSDDAALAPPLLPPAAASAVGLPLDADAALAAPKTSSHAPATLVLPRLARP